MSEAAATDRVSKSTFQSGGSEMRDAALAYAARGWCVFPLVAGNKQPATRRGFEDATADATQIREWWKPGKRYNIGIRTGEQSGLVVIDIDGPEGQDEWQRLSEHQEPFETLTGCTGGGGRHLLFKWPGITINNSPISESIHVRADGGYIVGPPSVHPDGPRYTWQDESAPVADLPIWLLELLINGRGKQPVAPAAERESTPQPATSGASNARCRAYALGAMRSAAAIVRAAKNGTRNLTLNRQAFEVARFVRVSYLTYAELEAAMRSAAQSAGLGEAEIAKTLNSAIPDGIANCRLPTEPPETFRTDDDNEQQPAGDKQDDSALLRFDPDDSGNADAIRYVCGDRYLFNDAYGWMRWTDTHFDADGAEAALIEDAKGVLRRRRVAAVKDGKSEAIVKIAAPSARHVRDALGMFKSMRYEPVKNFDTELHLLNVANGVLDLRRGEIVAHETSQRFTYCLSVDYDRRANAGAFMGFLQSAVGGGPEVVSWLQSWLGYCLTGNTNLEQLLYIHGPTRSGKGTLTETLLALMGKTARSVDFASFTAKREADTQNFDLAPLKAARLVIASESNQGAELNAAKIKGVTGGDEVTCAFKHRDVFTYRPQFKVMLVSNHPLNVDVDDDAAWTRVRVVEFPHSHAGSEDYSLKARMRSPEVLQGVLAWLVQGSMRYYAAGAKGIPTPQAVMAATKSQRDALDYVQQWLDARTMRAESVITPTGKLWKDYEGWCKDNGTTPRHITRFSKSLTRKGLKLDKYSGIRSVFGLGLQT